MKAARQFAQGLAAPAAILLAGLAIALLAQAEARILLAAEAEPGAPVCEEFYDKWDAPGIPSAMLAIAGIGRELMAAADCLKKNDVQKACAHWRKVIEVTDKLGAPLNKDRVGIEALVRDHECVAP